MSLGKNLDAAAARSPPDAATSRKRSRLQRALTIAGGIFVGLVIIELSLWALGFLFLGTSTRGAGTGRTILCVGDSWTHGLGSVSYGEALEQKLNARFGGASFRVVRSGIPGSNSSQGLRRVGRLTEEYRPDLMIVLLGNNDHQNLAASEYWKFEGARAGPARVWAARGRVALHSLRLYKLVRNARLHLAGRPTLDRFFVAEGSEGLIVRPKSTVVDLQTHRRQLQYNLTRIIDIARANDIDVLFMTYFNFHGYKVNEVILDVASAHGIPVVNNTVYYQSQIPIDERAAYYAGAHPTTKGHAFIADKIIEVLEEIDSDLLKSSTRSTRDVYPV